MAEWCIIFATIRHVIMNVSPITTIALPYDHCDWSNFGFFSQLSKMIPGPLYTYKAIIVQPSNLEQFDQRPKKQTAVKPIYNFNMYNHRVTETTCSFEFY